MNLIAPIFSPQFPGPSVKGALSVDDVRMGEVNFERANKKERFERIPVALEKGFL